MRNQKVIKLEQAINTLEYAKLQILEALGESDSFQMSSDQIDDLVADLEADIRSLEG